MMETEVFGTQTLTRICVKKAELQVEAGYVLAGVLMRRGGRLQIITNEGRCEAVEANQWGGILPDRQQESGK